jgi:RHS repeat-associated protein
MVEMRDGSDRTWQQFVVGWASGPSMGMDDWVRYDRNTDPTTDNDCLDSGGSASYYYHRDRNTRVVALTDEDGAVIERYEYDAYGNPTITIGDPGGALGFERGAVRHTSSVGNPFMHQGLFFVPSLRSYQNRFRQYHSQLGRFMQRDPLGYTDGLNTYEYLDSQPVLAQDPMGLTSFRTPSIIGLSTLRWIKRLITIIRLLPPPCRPPGIPSDEPDEPVVTPEYEPDNSARDYIDCMNGLGCGTPGTPSGWKWDASEELCKVCCLYTQECLKSSNAPAGGGYERGNCETSCHRKFNNPLDPNSGRGTFRNCPKP